MRCMFCNADMILMNVVQDDNMAVTGFEHRTFICSSCHDVERRFVFVGDAEAIPASAMPPIDGDPRDRGPLPPPLDTTPVTASVSTVQDKQAATGQGERVMQDAPLLGDQEKPLGDQEKPLFVI